MGYGSNIQAIERHRSNLVLDEKKTKSRTYSARFISATPLKDNFYELELIPRCKTHRQAYLIGYHVLARK